MFFAIKKGWPTWVWLGPFAAILMLPFFGKSQELSNKRIKTIFLDKDTLVLDTLSVIQGSEKINWKTTSFANNEISLDHLKGLLIRLNTNKEDSLHIEYEVLPFNFGKTYSKKPLSLIRSSSTITSQPIPSFKASADRQDNFLGFSDLNKSGSISRGITFGNNQDLSVNSNLNLQLSGTLKNDIQVLASVTDQNIPIQPEGNTQQIQDFDQVYIQLFNEKFKLIAGDLTLKPKDSYFLKYLKKGQGIGYTSYFNLNEDNNYLNDSSSKKLEVGVAAAASRGKFSRNTVPVLEGNQGPYPLTGKDNELFIVIISGTERVFLNGRQLVRGQDNDYVIDYNAAELTFTPNQLITSNSRVVVEFQYTDKNYARYLLQANNSYQSKGLNLMMNFFSEQDLKNQPLQQELTDGNRAFLRKLGDNLDDAIVPRIDSIGYSTDYPMYKMIDSLGYDSVFVYSNNKDSAVYKLSFSEVGTGRGHYEANGFSPAGRIFKWVEPNPDGSPNGNYAPVILLVTPKKNLIFSAGGDYKLSNQTTVYFEGGFTNNDVNTFSKLDKADNQGYSGKFQLDHAIPLEKNTNGWALKLRGNTEHTSKYFSPIERFREVEFNRNWNIPTQLSTDYQWINSGSVLLNKPGFGNLNYELSSFLHGKQFEGIKNNVGTSVGYSGGRIEFNGSIVKTKGDDFSSEFIRHESHVYKNLKYFALHYRDEHERNLFTDSLKDLSSSSYRFYNWELSIANIDSSNQQFRLFYGERLDRAVADTVLSKTSFARNYGLEFSLFNEVNNKLKGRVVQRDFMILNEQLTDLKPENTLTARLEYLFRLPSGAISSSTFFEIGSGLERKKEYLYKKVTDGQGIYNWIDRNEDGIEDLAEFEIAQPPDRGNYIRIYIPTNEFVKVYSNKFTENLNLQFPKEWKKSGPSKNADASVIKKIGRGITHGASLFSENISFQVGRKVSGNEGISAYNPFLKETTTDTSLVSLNTSIRNSLYFNRVNPVYSIFHTYSETESKTLLTTGFESRKNKFNEINGRWNFHRNYTINAIGTIGDKENLSFLEERNFLVNYRSVESQISYMPNGYFKLSLTAKYEEKRNHPDFGNEISFTRDFGTECRFNSLEKGSFTFQFNFLDITYNGENNTALSYEMLEALQTGNNFTWSIQFQRSLGNNLQLDIRYEGRKSNNVKTIHNGGMSLRALF